MIKPRGAIGGNEVYGWDFVGKTTGMIIDPISGTAGGGTSLGRRFIPGHTETPGVRTLGKNKISGGRCPYLHKQSIYRNIRGYSAPPGSAGVDVGRRARISGFRLARTPRKNDEKN